MKLLRSLLLLCLIAMLAVSSSAQVKIAKESEMGTPADASSMLDVSSTEKGVLVPRMTTAQRDAISSPANGLILFNTDDQCLQYFDASTSPGIWYCVGEAGSNGPCEEHSFKATMSASQSFTANVEAKVNATTEQFDIGTNYDPTNAEFTAPVDGRYYFTGQLHMVLSSGSSVTATIRVDGATASFGSRFDHTGTNPMSVVSTILDLNAGQKVALGVHGSANGDITGSNSLSYWAGFYINSDCGGGSGSGGNPVTSFEPNTAGDSLVLSLQDGTTFKVRNAADACKGFFLGNTSSQVVNTGGDHDVAPYASAVENDFTSGVDVSNGTFTVPTGEAGWYNITSSVRINPSGTPPPNATIQILVNGTAISAQRDHQDGSSSVNTSLSVASNYKLAEGDVVKAVVSKGGSTTSMTLTNAWFSAMRIDCAGSGGGGGTDDQTLSLANQDLSIESGNTVDLGPATDLAIYTDNAARDAAITSPRTGQQVFNQNCQCIQVYDGMQWVIEDNGNCGLRIRAHAGQSQSIAAGVWTPITFPTESFDKDSWHSTSTNTDDFIVPAGMAGDYMLTCSYRYVGWGSTPKDIFIAAYINDVLYEYTGKHKMEDAPGASLTVPAVLSEGDKVEFHAWTSNGSATIYVAYASIAKISNCNDGGSGGADDQTLTLTDQDLSIESGNTVDLGPAIDLDIYTDDSDRDTNVPTPRTGQSVYNQSCSCIQVYTGSSWTNVSGGAGGSASAFSVNKNNISQNVSSGGVTKIDYHSKVFDTNNEFDLTNDRFTPTTAGKYLLIGSAYFHNVTSGNNDLIVGLYKNGTLVAFGNRRVTGTASFFLSNVSFIVEANGTTDYFECFVYNQSGATVEVHGTTTQNFFAGHLISADGGGTDDQMLTLTNQDLSIESGNTVDLAPATDLAIYANDAARNTAITTPRNGQMVYQTDCACIKVYDGSAWSTSSSSGSGGSRVLIESKVASNSSSIDFTTGLDNTYDRYVLEITDLVPSTDVTHFYMRISDDGGASFKSGASDYRWGLHTQANADGVNSDNADAQIRFNWQNGVGNAAGENSSFTLWLSNPSNASTMPIFTWLGTNSDPTGFSEATRGHARYNTPLAYDAIRFLFSSGNITSGRFSLYGICHENCDTGGGSGSSSSTVTTITSTATLTATNEVVFVNNTSAASVNLPAAAANEGKRYIIKKISNNTIEATIDPDGSETIDGQTTLDLFLQNDAIEVISDGTNWQIIKNDIQPHMARMTRDAAQSIPVTTWTPIAFDNEDYDQGGIGDQVTNDRFDIRRTGKYVINGHWHFGTGGPVTTARAAVFVNNVNTVETYDTNTGGPNPVISCTLELNAGDFVHFYVRSEGGTVNTNTATQHKPQFTITEIR